MLRILELLKSRQRISVKELSQILKVSSMTVRRDLEVLRKNHILERSYGYAALSHGGDEYQIGGETYDLRIARIQNSNAKNSIAEYAASLIAPGDWIFLDNGTTIYRLAYYMPTDFEYTVVCYNFSVLTEILKKSNIKAIFPGGYYYPEDQMFASSESVDFIRRHRANKAFISASGLHKTLGITCINAHSVDSKRAIIESSMEHILLTDSSKFNKIKANHFAEFREITMLVTDSGISADWAKFIRGEGIDLRIV